MLRDIAAMSCVYCGLSGLFCSAGNDTAADEKLSDKSGDSADEAEHPKYTVGSVFKTFAIFFSGSIKSLVSVHAYITAISDWLGLGLRWGTVTPRRSQML